MRCERYDYHYCDAAATRFIFINSIHVDIFLVRSHNQDTFVYPWDKNEYIVLNVICQAFSYIFDHDNRPQNFLYSCQRCAKWKILVYLIFSRGL